MDSGLGCPDWKPSQHLCSNTIMAASWLPHPIWLNLWEAAKKKKLVELKWLGAERVAKCASPTKYQLQDLNVNIISRLYPSQNLRPFAYSKSLKASWNPTQPLMVERLTSSTVGTRLPAACRALHRAESVLHAWLSRTCSSIWFKCFTMSRDKPSSERINTSITCEFTVTMAVSQFADCEWMQEGALGPWKSRKTPTWRCWWSKERFFGSCRRTRPPPDNRPLGSSGKYPVPVKSTKTDKSIWNRCTCSIGPCVHALLLKYLLKKQTFQCIYFYSSDLNTFVGVKLDNSHKSTTAKLGHKPLFYFTITINWNQNLSIQWTPSSFD